MEILWQGLERTGEKADMLSQNVIPTMVNSMVELWRKEPDDYIQTRPVESTQAFPVDQEDFGKTEYVLLIGLDEAMNAVGYAVVTVTV